VNFAEALTQTAPKKGPSCSIGVFLATLQPAKRSEVDAALADADLQTAHLTRALELMAGRKFQPMSVGRHRKGGCNCQVAH
jgi:hypothetical protein